jgi:hypothetical protein
MHSGDTNWKTVAVLEVEAVETVETVESSLSSLTESLLFRGLNSHV